MKKGGGGGGAKCKRQNAKAISKRRRIKSKSKEQEQEDLKWYASKVVTTYSKLLCYEVCNAKLLLPQACQVLTVMLGAG